MIEQISSQLLWRFHSTASKIWSILIGTNEIFPPAPLFCGEICFLRRQQNRVKSSWISAIVDEKFCQSNPQLQQDRSLKNQSKNPPATWANRRFFFSSRQKQWRRFSSPLGFSCFGSFKNSGSTFTNLMAAAASVRLRHVLYSSEWKVWIQVQPNVYWSLQYNS